MRVAEKMMARGKLVIGLFANSLNISRQKTESPSIVANVSIHAKHFLVGRTFSGGVHA
jgi:hypothetical protein